MSTAIQTGSKKDKLAECVHLNNSPLISSPSKKLDYARIHPTNDVQIGAVVWSLVGRDQGLQKPNSA